MEQPELLTIREFAARHKPLLSEYTVRRLIREGRLPAHRITEKKIVLEPDALAQMLRKEQGAR